MSSKLNAPVNTTEIAAAGQVEVKVEPTDGAIPNIATAVKAEEATGARNGVFSSDDVMAAYKSLFGTLYNAAPQISITNVKRALGQSEILVKLAQEYDCLQHIRPHLGNLLSQFRQTLFVSIKNDPPRWLRLAVDLESPYIYTEALIHLVGCHPSWPWATPRTEIVSQVHKIVKAKAQHLAKLTAAVERDLFLNDIQASDGSFVALGGDFESWLAVQLFRDWFVREVRAAQYKSKDETNPMRIGYVYRKVKKGGEAYLPYDQVLRTLTTRVRDKTNSWDELAADLKILKEYASKTVEDLTKNKLMLDVEVHNIGYLTCTDITPGDYAWVVMAEE